jgi:hypothetical protein
MEAVVRFVVTLYVSDALLFLIFAAGVSFVVDLVARRFKHQFALAMTYGEARKICWFLVVVLLFTLLAFKFEVLSGGPGIETGRILSKGLLTRAFSGVAVGLAFVVFLVGLARWAMFCKQWFIDRWV